MNSVTCPHCGKTVEIDKALEGQIEARVLAAQQHEHEAEIQKILKEQESRRKAERDAAETLSARKLEGEKELLRQQAEADLEIEKKKLEQQLSNQQRKDASEQEALIKRLSDDAEAEKTSSKQLRDQLTELTKELREARNATANAELLAEKKISEEGDKIRNEVQKSADEKQRLNLAAKEKTITDLQKALDDAQRKAAQGSQQLQGEILELDLEEALTNAFRDDSIEPVAKGVNGADIHQFVRSQSGVECGSILWEIKRTKNWTDGWIPKLKLDLRNAKANVPVIISEAFPKELDSDMGQVEGVWLVKPKLAIILATLLRKSLLDVGREKAATQNRGDKADQLYSFVTSHEFSQQIESMVETYQEMTIQVTKERVAYEKMWALREKQARSLLLNTANIVGSMQGYIGQASMQKIKGLELGISIDE